MSIQITDLSVVAISGGVRLSWTLPDEVLVFVIVQQSIDDNDYRWRTEFGNPVTATSWDDILSPPVDPATHRYRYRLVSGPGTYSNPATIGTYVYAPLPRPLQGGGWSVGVAIGGGSD